MAPEALRPEDLLPSLADTAALERYLEAVEALRWDPEDGSTEERVERARAAMTDLRLGAPLAPSHYR